MLFHLILINKGSVLGKPQSSIWKVENSCICPVLPCLIGEALFKCESAWWSEEMDQHTESVGILYMGKALAQRSNSTVWSWQCFSSVCDTSLTYPCPFFSVRSQAIAFNVHIPVFTIANSGFCFCFSLSKQRSLAPIAALLLPHIVCLKGLGS